MAEIGWEQPELAGLALLVAVSVFFIVFAAYTAWHYKGRSAVVWAIIAATAQGLVFLLPLAIIGLTGLADPRDLLLGDDRPGFSTFRLFTEMSVVAGFTTLGVLSFLTQNKWKTCPACDARIPWRAKSCPHCASSQTVRPSARTRLEPGAYPRLIARTVHLPHDLEHRLKRQALPLKKRLSMTEDAAVSQHIRQLLERFDNDFERLKVEEAPEENGTGAE